MLLNKPRLLGIKTITKHVQIELVNILWGFGLQILSYRINPNLGACAYMRKNAFFETSENYKCPEY